MKFYRFILALVLVGVASCAISAQETDSKRLMAFGVAFYNLENLFDTIPNNPLGRDLEFTPNGDNKWDSAKYNTKLKNMAYAISQMKTKVTPLGPACIGVSEIENRSVLEDLVKQESIKDLNLQVIHHDSPDRRGVDVGMLYNPRLFKPINVTNHFLDIGYPTRDQMCVVGILGGSRVGIIVNHWPSRRGAKSGWSRDAAAALSKHIADSLLQVDPKMAVIIMGDLNDDPSDKSCAEVLGAVKKPKDCKKGGFYNPFWEKLDKGIGSYIYRGHWDLFDQIIINYNLLHGENGLKFHTAEVLNKEFLKQEDGQYKGYPKRTFSGGAWQGGYSDHFPTEIFLIKEVEK